MIGTAEGGSVAGIDAAQPVAATTEPRLSVDHLASPFRVT
jgi:hypothetical protein